MFKRCIYFFIFIFSLLACTCRTAYSQYYTLGSDPGRVRWSFIETENFKLIYPTETDSLARVYLSYLEGRRNAVNFPLDINPRKMPVILHPYTTKSNGLVVWAPKRIDLITSPDPYDTGSDHWPSHLVSHELRHVAQVEHFTKSIYKPFYYLFGEQITGLGLGLFVTGYTLEGDAVISETELSSSGRGRNADFTKYFRAMYLNGDMRNYDRLIFGSHKYYTPNEYAFGYLLGSSLKYTTGLYDITKDFFYSPVKYWYNLNALVDPTKKRSLKSIEENLEASQQLLAQIWKTDYESRGNLSSQSAIESKKKDYWLYKEIANIAPCYGNGGFTTKNATELAAKESRLYAEITNPIPIMQPDSKYAGSVIATKEGMETAKKLIYIDSCGNEHFIRFFNSYSSRLTYNPPSGKIFWTETVSANAAELEDYSVVMAFDIRNGITKSITKRTKYFNPAPSVTGDTLAVAEYPVTGSSFLTFIRTRDGKMIHKVEAPAKGQIKESVFDGHSVYSTVVLQNGLAIFKYEAGKWESITVPQHQGINNLRIHNGILYFSSDLDGVVNIYMLDPSSSGHPAIFDYGQANIPEYQEPQPIRLTNSEYGADYPYFAPHTDNLYYSEYGLKGYRAVVSTPENLQHTPVSFYKPYKYPLAEFITQQAKYVGMYDLITDTLDTFDTNKFPAKKYSKLLHAFRFHSWFPIYIDIDKIMTFNFENFTQAASLGVTLLSQNTLGNVVTKLSYGYVKDSYSGRFFHSGHAVIDARILGNLHTEIRADINNRNTRTVSLDYRYGKYEVKENSGDPAVYAHVLFYYPLRIDSHGWYRALTPQLSWNFSNDTYHSYEGKGFHPIAGFEKKTETIMKHELRYGISYGQVIPTATSQIYPRWGFGLTAYGASAPWSELNFGHILYLSGYSYFPGLTRQQGIKITAAYQKQFADGKIYYMSSFASMPRGYTTARPTEQYAKVTIDYAVPIYLGDFRIGPVFYFKRLQVIPFADYAIDRNTRKTAQYYSFGCDLLVDFHFIRLGFPISMGVRYARTGPQQNAGRNHFEFLFNFEI